MKTLHITNGNNTLELMRAAHITGDVISWNDVLHEGPVAANLSLVEQSKRRADYIIGQGWATAEQVKSKFQMRDRTILNFANYQRIQLCFEHDLYDQLQLIQILNWLQQQDLTGISLSLTQSSDYLGRQSPQTIANLMSQAKPVTEQQLELAAQAWRVFTSESSTVFIQFLQQDLSALPCLFDAWSRLLGEFPDKQSGLPLTEKLILQAVKDAGTERININQLFVAYQKLENAEFMADTIFYSRLAVMAKGHFPLLTFSTDLSHKSHKSTDNNTKQVALTDYARLVLAQQRHWFDDNQWNKYIGGCFVGKRQ